MLPPYAPPRIDRYEIKSLIGAGGMGTLYLARDTNPNTYRLVALKLLNANLDSEDLRERFGREARSLAALNHPNVVSIYDSGEYQWSPYIVMEYVRGETLAEKIARKAPMSTGQKLKLMTELCAGLAHAHEAGIIHRDIKPANLMVDHTGRLRLLDFGIARADVGATRFGPQMTHVNVRIGTPGYMSPEQIEGGDIDTRSDIFAVGAVLYELLAYKEAFSGTTTRQIENQVLQSQPVPLTTLVPDIDPELDAIVSKALAKDPAERYQTANDLETALEHVRWRLGLAETTPAGRSTPLPGANIGRKSHESRAETAYQRARAYYEEGAREAAKRYCIEALAEDYSHEAARALLREIDPRAWVAEPLRHDSTPIPPTVVVSPGTAPGVPGSRPGTRPGTGPSWTDQPTMLSSGPGTASGFGSEPTMIATRARNSGIGDAPTVVATREEHRSGGLPPSLQRYAPIIGVVGLVLLTAVIVVLLARWLLVPSAEGMTLTITRPTGGTILANGILCGTAGSDCSVTLDKGAGVELQVEADEGFRFAGFTGDCAPGGRTVMNSARTCGARFEEDAGAPGAAAMELLTIAPPTGGTIVAEGIKCGTQGKECTTSRPRGSQITLVAWADKGFTFQGFTGDCTQSGEAHMVAPRTCGATFVRSGAAAPPTARGPGRGASTPGTTAPGGTTATPGSSGTLARGTAPGGAGDSVTEPGGGSAPLAPKTVANNEEPAAPPKPPPPPPPAEVAQKEIRELLERYRRAYEARSFEALQRAYPGVPTAIRDQFKQIRSIELTFMGEPKFIQLDWFTGNAVVELQTQQTTEMPTGKRPPIEWLERIDLQKRGADNQWIIVGVKRTQK